VVGPAEAEAAALGAALQAAAVMEGATSVSAYVAAAAPQAEGGGVVEPDPEHAAAYAAAYARHVELGEALFGSGGVTVRPVLG
jgi:sugar (pentulose or hexulose) kinase